MADILTASRILDATDDVLRRFGPRKTSVVDVARELGVSHGTVYRHFASKAALRAAVTERWLHRVAAPLSDVVENDEPPEVRLRTWFDTLLQIKREKVRSDPEMFAAYSELAEEAGDVVNAHIGALIAQLARILGDGMKAGTFATADADVKARALFNATIRFHYPVHAAEWDDETIDQDFEAVWTLLLDGLRRVEG